MIAKDDNHAIESLLDRMDQLHSAPQVAQRILTLTRELDFDVRKVTDCIESDPALSAKILRVVNSSRYGLVYNVSSIRQGITYIGQRSLRLIALTFGLVESLTHGTTGKLYSDFWRRALTMATVASELGKTNQKIGAEDAYSAGLLADVGGLVLAQSEPERYKTICDDTPHGVELIEAERRKFGFSHPVVGARLMQRWELPESLVTATLFHHADRREAIPLEIAVRAGDLMADALWTPESPQLPIAKSLLQREFGLDLDGFIELAVVCQRNIAESAELFGVHLSGMIDCQRLLDEARHIHDEASLEAAMDLDSMTVTLEDPSAS